MESGSGSIAVISSIYSHADSAPKSWPIPYSGSFQMAGMFGFLGGYNILSVQGKGSELVNIDAGRLERYNQQYEMKLSAIIPFGLSAKPQITIKQTITASRQ